MSVPSKSIVYAYKFKLDIDIDSDIKQTLAHYAGNCRFVYNWALQRRIESWKCEHKTLSYKQQSAELTQLKTEKEKEWLQLSPAQTLQQTLKDVEKAFKNFWRKCKTDKSVGFPRYKKKFKSTDALKFPDPKAFNLQRISRNKGRIKLPKLGFVKFWWSRKIVGTLRHATVIREGRDWFIAICVSEAREVIQNTKPAVGIDRGVARTLTLSDARGYAPDALQIPMKVMDLEARRAVLQRRLRNKPKSSNNWRKGIQRISYVHRKEARIRKDWAHKITTSLSKNHGVIYLEDLRVKNMMKRAKGTKANPGKNVKAKRGLNRSIQRQGWSQFETLLHYKAEWNGSKVLLVDPKYTSQSCSVCGYVDVKNRKTRSRFVCKSCGLVLDADENAACNIITVGQTGCALGEVKVSSVCEEGTALSHKA